MSAADPVITAQLAARYVATIRTGDIDGSLRLLAPDLVRAAPLEAGDGPAERGRTLELVGDALTPPEVAAEVSAAVGRPVPYAQRPIEELRRISERFARGYELLNSGDGSVPEADIDELRALHPGLMSFRDWLSGKGAELIRPLLDPQP